MRFKQFGNDFGEKLKIFFFLNFVILLITSFCAIKIEVEGTPSTRVWSNGAKLELLACLLVCLLACLLLTCLLNYLPAYLLSYLLAYLLACLLAYLLAC